MPSLIQQNTAAIAELQNFVNNTGLHWSEQGELQTALNQLTASNERITALLNALKMAKTVIGHPDDQFSQYIAQLIKEVE